MKLETKTRIRASVGKTINIGNYQSIRIEFSIEEDDKGNRTLEEQLTSLYKELNEMIEEKEKEIKS